MIRSIKLINFQTHKHLHLHFDPQITTIIGPTDCGKSSIIRALRWCLLNRPSGDAFLRKGADYVRVEIEFGEHKVIRKKGEENVYILDDTEYKAFASSVPDPILNLVKITENNFQNQHDASFWLSESPGTVAKELNKIVDLGIIDEAQTNIAKEVRKAKSTLEVTQERLKSSRQEFKSLRYVVEKDEKLRIIEGLNAEFVEKGVARASVAKLVANGVKFQTLIETATEAQLKRRFLLKLGGKLQQSLDSAKSLRTLLTKLENIEEQQCELKIQRKEVKAKLKEAMSGKCPVCEQTIKS